MKMENKQETAEGRIEPTPDLMKVISVPIDEIELSPFQMCSAARRTQTVDLEESIRTSGMLQYPLMRLGSNGMKQIVAGERRYRAAKNLGWKFLPAYIVEMTDEEAMLAVATENYQRKDLGIFDEATQIKLLRDKGMSFAMISSRLGMPVKRAAQVASISEFSDEVLKVLSSEKARWEFEWGLDNLSLLAGLQQDTILEILDSLHGRNHPNTVKNAVGHRTSLLASAPWKLDDDTLHPEAGSCSLCPYRSSHQNELFGADGATEKKAGKGERCLNLPCWEIKLEKFVSAKVSALRDKNETVVLLGQGISSIQRTESGERVYPEWMVEKKKKDDKNAVPAVMMNGNSVGQVVWIADPEKSKSELIPKENKLSKPQTKDPAKLLEYEKESLATRKERHGMRRNALFLQIVAERLNEFKVVDFDAIISLVYAFGLDFRADRYVDQDPVDDKKFSPWDKYDEAQEKLKAKVVDFEAIAFRLWRMLLPVLLRRIAYVSAGKNVNQMNDANKLCIVFNIDDAAIWVDIMETLPDPKSWAQSADRMKELKGQLKEKEAKKKKK